MNLVFSILGLLGGILCCIADLLLDLKGKDNKKIGKYGFIDTKWLEMDEFRFKLSIVIAMIAVPLYSLGIYSLGNQINGNIGFALKILSLIATMEGFFIHSILCLMPVIYKTINNDILGEKVINKIYETIKFPFYFLYTLLILVPTILVIIAIINHNLNVPIYCVLLNPTVFLIIGVLLRKIKYEWFYDLPGIIMPSLGVGMFGLIGILNLL